MYWSNVPEWIRETQKAVFDALGLEVTQHEATGVEHGRWINQVLSEAASEDAILFVDIDCFPLEAEVVHEAFRQAERGMIVGVAQTANHLEDSDFIYAAPSFLCLSKKTWADLGSPDLSATDSNDVAMILTRLAEASGIGVNILFPSFVCHPQWQLGKFGVTGYGTFYDNKVFHLFQSREIKQFSFAFRYVADRLINKQPIDYLYLYKRMNSTRLFIAKYRTRIDKMVMRRLKMISSVGGRA
jgi:hypothetical protein